MGSESLRPSDLDFFYHVQPQNIIEHDKHISQSNLTSKARIKFLDNNSDFVAFSLFQLVSFLVIIS